MSENYDSGYFTVNDDFLLADDRGYVGGGSAAGGDNFWAIKADEMRTVYFTTPGPWTKRTKDNPNGDGGWWAWREIFAQQGLTRIGDLPPGMKAFPVRDQEEWTDADGNQRRRDIHESDPRYDELLALVVPYVQDRARERGNTRPTRPVRDQVGVSVVEAIATEEVNPDGSTRRKVDLFPKVLTMTGNRYRKINSIITSFRAMNPKTFTLMGFPWRLGFTGTAAAEVAVFQPLVDEPPIDLPEPHDIPVLLDQKRAQVLHFVQASTGVDTSRLRAEWAAGETAAPVEQAAPAEGAAPAESTTEGAVLVDFGDNGSSSEPVPQAPVSRAEVYGAMTDARLKTLLRNAGVSVKPRTPRAELMSLAVAHLS